MVEAPPSDAFEYAEPTPEERFRTRSSQLFDDINEIIAYHAEVDDGDAETLSGLTHAAIALNSASTPEQRRTAEAQYRGIARMIHGTDALHIAHMIDTFRSTRLGTPTYIEPAVAPEGYGD